MGLEHDEDRLDVAAKLVDAVREALDLLDADLADESAPGARPAVRDERREERDLVARTCERVVTESVLAHTERKRRMRERERERDAPRMRKMERKISLALATHCCRLGSSSSSVATYGSCRRIMLACAMPCTRHRRVSVRTSAAPLPSGRCWNWYSRGIDEMKPWIIELVRLKASLRAARDEGQSRSERERPSTRRERVRRTSAASPRWPR